MENPGMTSTERRATIALAGIFSLRMLGLFMILPVFALYANQLTGVTPTLVGVAIGAYGLTQAILQIPFGVLSDRFGRKRIIAIGLVIFAGGSVVAALSTSMWGVILGRALQGAGAIAGPVMALAADLTRDTQRTKAMAVIGMSIGFSFAVAIVAAPAIDHWIGVPGIFWLIGGLAVTGIGVLFLAVPNPIHSEVHRDAEAVPAQMGSVYRNLALRRLDFGILSLHAILTANWVVMPLALSSQLSRQHHWWVYLPVLILSVIAMVPFIIMAEKHGRLKPVFLGAVALLGSAELLLVPTHTNLWAMGGVLFLFFTAFNLLEAILPSLMSKLAPPEAKGTAMGIYSTAQFLGAFIGGTLGGWIHGRFGISGVFVMGTVFAGLWLLVATGLQDPRQIKGGSVIGNSLSTENG
ncbi:putative transport protein YajR [Gammaproteobacteria bacterium]